MPVSRLRSRPTGRGGRSFGKADLLDVTRRMVDAKEGLARNLLTADAVEVYIPSRGDVFKDSHEQEVRAYITSEGNDVSDDSIGGAVCVGGAYRRLITEHDLIRGLCLAVRGGEEELITVRFSVVYQATGAEAATSVSEEHTNATDLVVVLSVAAYSVDVAVPGAIKAEDGLETMGNVSNVERREGLDVGRLEVLQDEEGSFEREGSKVTILGHWIVEISDGSPCFVRANEVELSSRWDTESLECHTKT